MADARIDRTKHLIFASLDKLLSDTAFRDITVSALASHAGIGRQTFYRHFDSVGAVLEEQFRQGLEEQLALAKTIMAKSDDWAVSVNRFAFERVAAEPHVAKVILSGEAGPNALTYFRDQVTALYAIDPVHKRQAIPAELQRFAVSYHSGALVAVLLEWIEAGCAPDADTMSRFMADSMRVEGA